MYKAFVGKGNNSILIKSTLKNRFWWNITDVESDANNIHWTQHRDNKYLQALKSVKEDRPTVTRQKTDFFIPILQEKTHEEIKNVCKTGFNKLLSEEEIKNISTNPFETHIPAGEYTIPENPNKNKVHNHLEFNWNLTNKKALYYNMKSYYEAMEEDPFANIPLTFHIKQ